MRKVSQAKTWGKAFKWTEDQANGPKVGKLSCMRTGWKASRSRGERLRGRIARDSQKDRVHLTQNLEDHGQGLHCVIFTGENYWRVSGREVTEFDLKIKKKITCLLCELTSLCHSGGKQEKRK